MRQNTITAEEYRRLMRDYQKQQRKRYSDSEDE
jgi:hypothetical protein